MTATQEQHNSEGKKEGLGLLQMLGIGFIIYVGGFMLMFLDEAVFKTRYFLNLPDWMGQAITVIYYPLIWLYFTLFR